MQGSAGTSLAEAEAREGSRWESCKDWKGPMQNTTPGFWLYVFAATKARCCKFVNYRRRCELFDLFFSPPGKKGLLDFMLESVFAMLLHHTPTQYPARAFFLRDRCQLGLEEDSNSLKPLAKHPQKGELRCTRLQRRPGES